MCKDRIVFLVAGTLTLVGALLAIFVNKWFVLMCAFVGLNMFQAALTGWCPLTKILNAQKVEKCTEGGPLD